MRKTAEVIPLGNAMSQQKWIDRIVGAWREQLPSIFETGNLLEAAKAELRYGEWAALFRDGKLPFKKRTAEKLIAIAQDNNLRDGSVRTHLPVAWTILYALTKLTNGQFAEGVNSGAINPNMTHEDVKILRGIEPKERKKKEQRLRSLDDWCDDMSVLITEATSMLPLKEKEELLNYLKEVIANLENPNV